jgi:hypothetical protein
MDEHRVVGAARRTGRGWMGVMVGVAFAAAFAPGEGRAGSCDEQLETCLESCQIDFGMERERKKLTDCVVRCDERREDCRDLRREQREVWGREPLPAERPAPRPDPYEDSWEDEPASQSEDEWAPPGRGEGRRAGQWEAAEGFVDDPPEERFDAERTDSRPPPEPAYEPPPRPVYEPPPEPVFDSPVEDDFDRGGEDW